MDKVYGAYAKVYIKYEGNLHEIGSHLEKCLEMQAFRFENREDEPYDLLGYAEMLGFEVQLQFLKANNKWPRYEYLFEAITTDSFDEIHRKQMHDISHWMARYIALMCKVITLAVNGDGETGQSFFFDKTTRTRGSNTEKCN